MNTVPIFVPEPMKGSNIAAPFWFRFPEGKGSVLFNKKLPPSFFEYGVSFVEAEQARAIVLPHGFDAKNADEESYIWRYADMGEKLKIPVFIFVPGDFTDRLRFDPRVYIFRQSVYRSLMRPQDIVTPTLTEDNAQEGIAVRQKQEVPVVSFCGQGDYQTFIQQVKYHLKVWLWKLPALALPVLRARIIGVYWRKKMMQACRTSPLVTTNFIIRRSFSGSHRTIELDPAQARAEYLDSIVNADFVLAPKGDGNYSNRFLKTLCMGRIPVLPDTDAALPLEEEINYSDIMVRVPMDSVRQTPQLVREWYDARDAVRWEAAQRKAREIFETRLRFDAFFEYFFTTIVPTVPVNAAEYRR